jgi:hypothetical protein
VDEKPVAGEEIVEASTAGTSLTRRKALGIGAVALGGAALGGLADVARAGTAAGTPGSGSPVTHGDFGRALKRCVTDSTFYNSTIASPTTLTKTFPKLTHQELEVLRDCAIMSGADVGSINKVRDAAISNASSKDTGVLVNSGGQVIGFAFACCCCCCCKNVTFNAGGTT